MKAFGEILHEAVAFHGHLCPGQVLGVAKTTAWKGSRMGSRSAVPCVGEAYYSVSH
jgi:formylmethanofuran dehydrogenase subunit E